ncbi:MAG: Uma2 family endonuclease [Microcoleus sp. PH2017_03_ELD_O_A]|nr:Uma2 family endonuclease [Microcoleus sp. PH2017_03_ELD_O_A]
MKGIFEVGFVWVIYHPGCDAIIEVRLNPNFTCQLSTKRAGTGHCPYHTSTVNCQLSTEEYLEWEAQQDIRYEYVNGEVFAMTGGTIPHNDLALNFYTAVRPHLRSRGCRANVSDVKLQVSPRSRYYYPDVIVSCDPEDMNARKFIQHPKLIVEVLSPGTSGKDRDEKFTAYLKIPTLQEYILIDSEKISVERYCRGEGKMWLYYSYSAGEIVTLSSIEFELAIELLYEGVTFEIETETETEK